ncbi:MAG: hypothetical protein IID33_12110 [Planctomycetes bacterium]|nr:hypothetical protein [Planctomycetota bacterium]
MTDRGFVHEEGWRLADPSDTLAFWETELPQEEVVELSFYRKRISFHERLFPPMGRRPDVDPFTGEFAPSTPASKRWDDELDTRRFCWAVFHRLRTPVIDDRTVFPIPERYKCVTDELGGTRSFDMYYITLRRGQSTFRYARQDPGFTPDPCDLTVSPVPPAAMDPGKDVMFPVPWRVQVEFLKNLALARDASGIPTEIQVPPGESFDANETLMLIQMFQRGTRFIDEINGQVYEVIERRVNATADQATLTLDREVVVEDLDVPLDAGDPDSRCDTCLPGVQDLEELIRTVWVFPPPVEPRSAADAPVIFNGSPPAVAIDIRTLSVAPN